MTKIKPQRYFWREKNANSFIGKCKTEDSLLTIYKNILNLIDLLLLNCTDIEIERQKVEEKEGSFYNGKIVVK